jgi:hypothetical protein
MIRLPFVLFLHMLIGPFSGVVLANVTQSTALLF